MPALALGALALVAIGLFLARDDGSGGTATDATALPVVGGDLHSLVADPTVAGRLWVGGHQAVAVSDDGGRSWRAVPSLADADAMGWAFTPGTVWQGGHPGLRRSGDGFSFAAANAGLPSTDVHALGGGTGVIYAASPGVGFFASTDDGRTWEIRSREAGRGFMGRVLVDPADREHLVAPDMQAGAVESRDGGRTWRRLGGPSGVMWVAWRGGDPRFLVASGAEGVAASDDGGATWRDLAVPDGTALVEASPSAPETLWAAAHEGDRARVRFSIDGGRTWRLP